MYAVHEVFKHMAVPKGWSVKFANLNGGLSATSDVRAICPHCNLASTFLVRAQNFEVDQKQRLTHVHLLLECNYSDCKRTIYVHTSIQQGVLGQRPGDFFFMYPSRAIEPAHPSVPVQIAEDWIEAQRAVQASAPKAAAVMFRRVLYGVLMDKGCKLHPISEGLKQLINDQRLPAIFDEWLPAIRDDGHDGAHPDRALQVSTDNLMETMEYTSELLRFLYVEPYEFQQRKSRNSNNSTKSAASAS